MEAARAVDATLCRAFTFDKVRSSNPSFSRLFLMKNGIWLLILGRLHYDVAATGTSLYAAVRCAPDQSRESRENVAQSQYQWASCVRRKQEMVGSKWVEVEEM